MTGKPHIDRLMLSMQALMRSEMDTVLASLEELCESPIEIMLGASLCMTWRMTGDAHGIGGYLDVADQETFETDRGGPTPVLVPQYKRAAERYDFALFLPSQPAPLMIECDGHDFHERTKQQARKDRSRDRRLQASGAPVFRFTGSEIWADPLKCAQEVITFASGVNMGPRSFR